MKTNAPNSHGCLMTWPPRLFVLMLLLLFAGNGSAQTSSTTDGSTPLGTAPGAPAGSYSLNGFDNVNLFNGNNNFALPIFGVGGRGGAHYSMMLPIEQKWTVNKIYDGLYEVDRYVPVGNWWTGLPPGYGPGVLQGRQTGSQPNTCTYFMNGHTYRQNVNNTTLTRLTFTGPDKTEYEFRDQLTGGQPQPRTACTPAGTGGASRGTVFTTADGTAATFISDATIFDFYLPGQSIVYPSGYLMMRDGLRYRIDNGLVTWMRDRNGNRLTFTYDANSRVTSITDSLNRQVNIAYDVSDVAPYGLCDQISFKGFGGASRIIRASHTSLGNVLRSGYALQTYAQLFPELDGSSTSQFNPTVVSSVWLPDTDGVTRRYQFFYNSYGELARVVLPTGGAFEYDYAAGSTLILKP
jgi:YD repeat-containing protein